MHDPHFYVQILDVRWREFGKQRFDVPRGRCKLDFHLRDKSYILIQFHSD